MDLMVGSVEFLNQKHRFYKWPVNEAQPRRKGTVYWPGVMMGEGDEKERGNGRRRVDVEGY